jgi:hypothetical protein
MTVNLQVITRYKPCRSVQPGFWNNYVHKCVFSAATRPIDLAAFSV